MFRRKSFENQFTKSLRACVESLERRQLLSLTVPALSSDPAAPYNLYLDFDGDSGRLGVPQTPAFSLDPDKTSFSSQEVAAIKQIWAQVSDAFSPFNVNVTTVSPGVNDVPGKTLGVLFGGHNPGFVAGESGVGAFNSSINRCFIYDSMDDPGLIADVAEHEAGHGFGLWHQSTPTEQYRTFDGYTGAIMSASYNARLLWWKGYSYELGATQDDMAVLANTLGYRPDDYANTPTAAASLVMNSGTAHVSGIISNDSDQDWFTLNWAGGDLTLQALGGKYSNKLDPRIGIRDASGTNLIASAEDAPVGQILYDILPAGTYRIGIMSGSHMDNGVSTRYGEAGQYTLDVFAGNKTGEQPFTGTPIAIGATAATTIQYEDYDIGGEGVAYHDVDPYSFSDTGYRQGEAPLLSFADSGTGAVEGYVSTYALPGSWTNYTVNVKDAGTYRLAFRTNSDMDGGTFHLELDDQNISGPVVIPATGHGSLFRTTVAPALLTLPAGQHVLRLAVDSAPNVYLAQMNWFQLIPISAGGQTSYGATPVTVSSIAPTVIQSEDYDRGGQGVAYNDTTPATNTGAAYRKSEGVDLKSTTDTGGGYRVSDAFTGEWLEYSINVANTGTYDVAVRCGSPGAGGAFHFELDGQPIGRQLATPNTGAFDTMQDVVLHGVQLLAGTHVLRLAFDTVSSASGAAGGFNFIRITPVAAPTISVMASDPDATQPKEYPVTDPGQFTVTRTGSIDTDLWVSFNVTGTALANHDYSGLGTATLIPASASSVNLALTPWGPDGSAPKDMTVVLTLAGDTFYSLGSVTSAIVTIHPLPVNTAQISGTIFNDANGNAIRDAGEAGIASRTVYVDLNNNSALDSNEQSTTTDSAGTYTFLNLPAGTYKVRQVLPAGWNQTTPSKGYGWSVTLAASQTAGAKDFGARQTPVATASISGQVFNDKDGDGTKDSNESGIAARKVWIDLDNDGVLDSNEKTVTTDSNGNYKFTSLAAGTYKVRQMLPTGWKQTTPAKGYGWSVTLTAGQSASGKNFGAKSG